MDCWLILIDKCWGVRAIDIGMSLAEFWLKQFSFLLMMRLLLAHYKPVLDMLLLWKTCLVPAALLIDTSNAFNSINRWVALHSISILCLALSTALHNAYDVHV